MIFCKKISVRDGIFHPPPREIRSTRMSVHACIIEHRRESQIIGNLTESKNKKVLGVI